MAKVVVAVVGACDMGRDASTDRDTAAEPTLSPPLSHQSRVHTRHSLTRKQLRQGVARRLVAGGARRLEGDAASGGALAMESEQLLSVDHRRRERRRAREQRRLGLPACGSGGVIWSCERRALSGGQ